MNGGQESESSERYSTDIDSQGHNVANPHYSDEQDGEHISTPSSFQYSESDSETSEDSTLINRALPNDEVYGYNIYGQPIQLPPEQSPGEKLQKYLELVKNPSLLFRKVLDKDTGQEKQLTDEQYEKLEALITKNKPFSGMPPQERFSHRFVNYQIKMSINSDPMPIKSHYLRKQEIRRTAYFAKLIAEGKLDPDDVDGYKKLLKQKLDQEKRSVDVWAVLDQPEIYRNHIYEEHQRLKRIPVPKLAFPKTDESYNPPAEYLKDEEVNQPRSLRRIKPKTVEMILQRYNRQLDLFESIRNLQQQQFQGTSDEYLKQHLKRINQQKLKPYPVFCDLIIRSHIGRVNSIDISPNGKFIASGGQDGVLRIFELLTGKMLKQIVLIKHTEQNKIIDKYYGHEISCVRFCPNKKYSIVASAVGNQIVFVNLKLSMGINMQETLHNTQRLLNPDVSRIKPCPGWRWECIQGVAQRISAKNDEIVIANHDPEKERQYDVQEDVQDPRFDQMKYQLDHSGRPGGLTVYASLNSDVLLRIHSPNVVNTLDFHPGGDYVLSMSRTKERVTNLSVHRLSTGQSIAPFNKALALQAAIFNRQSPALIVFEQTSGFTYDLKNMQKEQILYPNIRQIQTCTHDPFTGDLTVSGTSGSLAMFKYAAGPKPDGKNHFSQVSVVATDSRQGLVAVGAEDGVIQILRIVGSQLISCMSLHGHGVKNMYGVMDVRLGPGGELVSCGGDGTIRVWR